MAGTGTACVLLPHTGHDLSHAFYIQQGKRGPHTLKTTSVRKVATCFFLLQVTTERFVFQKIHKVVGHIAPEREATERHNKGI